MFSNAAINGEGVHEDDPSVAVTTGNSITGTWKSAASIIVFKDDFSGTYTSNEGSGYTGKGNFTYTLSKPTLKLTFADAGKMYDPSGKVVSNPPRLPEFKATLNGFTYSAEISDKSMTWTYTNKGKLASDTWMRQPFTGTKQTPKAHAGNFSVLPWSRYKNINQFNMDTYDQADAQVWLICVQANMLYDTYLWACDAGFGADKCDLLYNNHKVTAQIANDMGRLYSVK
ncbi:MAG: hypothetical protein HQM09_17345 [Candidatus Riflebacteria bacterium]|nr:hypothetical protein [Candidatus Riflebacteria bacterium]